MKTTDLTFPITQFKNHTRSMLMNTTYQLLASRFFTGGCLAMALLMGVLGTAQLQAQPNPNPPELMTYQGFLVDANGTALGNAAPQNFDIVFSIHTEQTGGAQLWAEQQTVTVDKGYFSVMLGEGADPGSGPPPPLSTIFQGPTASDRYIGVTVKGIGAGGANVDILPRLRLMTSPYSYLSRQSMKVIQANGNDLITSTGNAVTVSGTLAASSLTGNGSGLTALNANNITTGTLNTARVPNLDAGKITSGVFNAARIPSLSAGYINSGVFSADRIPGLDASKINSGIFSTLRIPNLDASKITSGRIPQWHLDTDLVRSTTTSGRIFEVVSNTARIHESGNTARHVRLFRTSGAFYIRLYGGHVHGSAERAASYDGDSNWDFSSDRRLKKDIVDVESVLDRAMQVQVRRYRWKDEGTDSIHKLGVIAQELQPLFPEMVSLQGSEDGDSEPMLAVGYSDFGLIALKALQELKTLHEVELASLKAQIGTVIAENAELRQRLGDGPATTAVSK